MFSFFYLFDNHFFSSKRDHRLNEKKKKKKLNGECEPYRFLEYEMIILCKKNVFIQNILSIKKKTYYWKMFLFYYIDTSRVRIIIIIIEISEFVLT